MSKYRLTKLTRVFGPSREFRKQLESSWKKLYRLAFAWTHDSHLASDLAQDTVTKALKNWRQLNEIKTMHAWLYRILANSWRDHGRAKRDLIDIDEIELVCESDPEQENSRFEIIKKVRSAVAKLSPDQNQIITLIDLEGCSYSEVAHILGIPIGTVMSRLCRARRKLQHDLQQNAFTTKDEKTNIVRIKT